MGDFMFNMIKNYIDKMSISEFNKLALNNDIVFSYEELSFSYEFVKNNWFNVLENISDFDLSMYKDKFSDENYNKICKLFKSLYDKYHIFLK